MSSLLSRGMTKARCIQCQEKTNLTEKVSTYDEKVADSVDFTHGELRILLREHKRAKA